ncbi:MAG: Bbp16 family capsid cement protein [Sphingomicrobium sp.]
MYMDAQNRPSLAQSVAAAASTIVSTDSIDLLSALDNPGRSSVDLRAIAVMTTALVGAGASIQAQLISSASSNLGSPTVLASGPVTTVANAGIGTVLLDVPMPDVAQRYIGFQYVISGATTTAGAVTAGFVGGSDRGSRFIPMNLGL